MLLVLHDNELVSFGGDGLAAGGVSFIGCGGRSGGGEIQMLRPSRRGVGTRPPGSAVKTKTRRQCSAGTP